MTAEMTMESLNETYRQEMENYILGYLGPKHLPYDSLIPITGIYSLIFICGLVGNFSTCIVIYKAHYMRTSTNYYLFNLAVSFKFVHAFAWIRESWLHQIIKLVLSRLPIFLLYYSVSAKLVLVCFIFIIHKTCSRSIQYLPHWYFRCLKIFQKPIQIKEFTMYGFTISNAHTLIDNLGLHSRSVPTELM